MRSNRIAIKGQNLPQESKAPVRAQEATSDETEMLHILARRTAEGNQAAGQWSAEKGSKSFLPCVLASPKSKKKRFLQKYYRDVRQGVCWF